MTIDILLILALYAGFAQFLSLPFIQIPLWLIGAIFLMILAYDSIKNADQDIHLAGEKVNKSFAKTYRNGSLSSQYPLETLCSGYLCLVLYWQMLIKIQIHLNLYWYATGILAGILLHDIGLLTIVSLTRKVMNRTMIKWTSIIAGILLLGFGCYFFYEFYIGIKVYF